MNRGGVPARLSRGAVFLLLAGCSSTDQSPASFSRDALLKPETCRECHEQHYTEWSGSMHAYASEDPVFLAMNARGQLETGGALGNFCVKCHAPMAVNEGATENGLNLDELPAELQGVTCYFCHNAESVNDTHNNPVTLSNDTVLRGNVKNPVANRVHDAEYSPMLDGNDIPASSRLCGACHDIVVPRELNKAAEDVHLERTFKEWDESLFSIGPRGRLSCNRCHMETEKGVPISSAPGSKSRPYRHMHDFPGVDVALTPFPEMEPQRQAVERMLDTSIRVEVCVTTRHTFTVALDNIGAGHNLPSGASQDRRLWVELQLFDKPGDVTPLLQVGALPPSGDIDETASEDGSWILRDHAFDSSEKETHMFWNVARVEPGTLLAPLTVVATEQGFHREITTRSYSWDKDARTYPDRIVITLKMTPVAKAVLNDLVANGDLTQDVAAAVPTHTLLPNRGGGGSTTVEWHYDRAYSVGDLKCVETAARRPEQAFSE